MSSPNIKSHFDTISVLSKSNEEVFSAIIDSAEKSLLNAINEIFLNIGQLRFHIEHNKRQKLALKYLVVDSLAVQKGHQLKRVCLRNRQTVQLGLKAVLNHFESPLAT